MLEVIAVIVSYCIGSISFSFLYGKLFKGIDIRQHGSGNAGATNTLRTLGARAGILVFVLDIAKAVLAVFIGRWLADGTAWLPDACGLAVIVGHNWPIFFGFRGGKGIASTIGAMATLAWLPTLLACLTAVVIISVTRYVSLGSLLLTLTTVVLLPVFHRPMHLFWFSLVITGLAWYRHRGNIAKLLKGQERKLGQKKLVS